MMFKTIIFAFLAVGVLAEYEVSEAKREEIRAVLRQQCEENGAADKVDEIENVGKGFVDCVKGLLDPNVLKSEIEAAKPNGALDEVFKKYCAKTPELKTCIANFLDGLSPCVEPAAREHLISTKNGTNQLIDFICYKDGDRIALFIAEHGPECFQSKAADLNTCVDNIKNSFSSIEAAKSMTLAQKCGKFDELSACVVQKLEQCDTPTPGNMAESMLKFVRKGSPCNTALPLN